MKNFYSIIYLVVIVFFSQQLQAQQTEQIIQDVNQNPKLIKFEQDSKSAVTDPKQLLLPFLPKENKDNFQLIRSSEDDLGVTHQKFQQYYNGIKVEHATYTVHIKGNQPLSISGDYIPVKEAKAQKSQISEEEALQYALEYVNAETYMWEDEDSEQWAKEVEPNGTFYPEGELVYIKDYFNEDRLKRQYPVLAFKFNIYAQKPLSRAYIYVNAENGEIVLKDAILKSFPVGQNKDQKILTDQQTLSKANGSNNTKSGAYAATRYSGAQTISTSISGSNYVLKAYNRGDGIETYNLHNFTFYWLADDFTDNNNQWTADEFDNAEKDNAALDAHWGSEKVWDYWMIKHGRNSYDANGGIIKNYVHYDNNSDEASWNGSEFSYGDGSSLDALTSLDVLAYTIGHAINDYTADLIYNGESAAITGGLSIIWAACVTNYAAPYKSIWEIGEDIGSVYCDLSNPNAHGHPDTYLGTNWYSGTNNDEQANINSGVLGYWFYLLSEGGSGTNDNGHAYSVSGIGIEDAARITYRTEAIYLNPDGQYADLRTATIVAAEDLFGAGSNVAEQVKNAWDAVGVYALPQGSSEYCDSYGRTYSWEWISQIQIGTFTNSSGAAGYSNFTSLDFDLNSGDVVSVSLTPGFSSGSYYEYWRIWIDLNGDNDFDDVNEMVFSGASNSTVTGSFTVPVASAATTRMRIKMDYSSSTANDPCGSYSYGETEDYTVNIFNPAAPTTPANLAEISKSKTSVNLAWDASTDDVGVTGYKIFQDGVEVKDVSGTNATVSGLSPQTSYVFYVVAYDADDNMSAHSNSINVVTKSDYPNDTQAPTAPQNLNYSNVGSSSVDLYWTESTDNVGVAGYNIYQDGIKVASVNTTSTTINGLNSQTFYSFYVKAYDMSDNLSAASNTRNITTASSGEQDTEPPSAPQNLTASNIGKTSLKLTWNPSTDNVGVDRYFIYKNFGGMPSAIVTTTSALFTGLTEGTEYSFYVIAYDAAFNHSLRSSYLYVTTKTDGDIEAPSTPQNLEATEIGTDYIRLSWDESTDNFGVAGYRVYKDWIQYSVTGGASEIITGLSEGTQYSFQVRAFDNNSNLSNYSSSIYVTTESTINPEEPVTYPSYCSANGNSQAFEWIDYVGLGAIDNATGPEAGGYGDYTHLTPTLLSAHSYNLYLSAGFSVSRENEYWRVWIDFNRDGDFNDQNEMVAQGGPLAYDGVISAPFVVPTTIESGYTVMRVAMRWGDYPSSCGTFQHGEVEDYPIELSSAKTGGTDSEIFFSNTRDISETISVNKAMVYPNPANDYITIYNKSRDQDLNQISVYNITGSLVKVAHDVEGNHTIDISDLPSGMYTVIIKTNRDTITQKFIKQ